MAKKEKPSNRQRASRDPDRTARLIEQCRQGDAAAAEAIFARYVNRLTALARSRLSRKLAARFDASDVVMSAYRSFFVGLARRGFAVNRENELWQLLVQITLRKLYRQIKRHSAARRTVGRDVNLHLADGSPIAIPGREPRPDEAAAVADEVAGLLAPLPPTGRRILELRLQGEEIAAIAATVAVSERTVRRWLERVKRESLSRRATAHADRPRSRAAPAALLGRSLPAPRRHRRAAQIPKPRGNRRRAHRANRSNSRLSSISITATIRSNG